MCHVISTGARENLVGRRDAELREARDVHLGRRRARAVLAAAARAAAARRVDLADAATATLRCEAVRSSRATF